MAYQRGGLDQKTISLAKSSSIDSGLISKCESTMHSFNINHVNSHINLQHQVKSLTGYCAYDYKQANNHVKHLGDKPGISQAKIDSLSGYYQKKYS